MRLAVSNEISNIQRLGPEQGEKGKEINFKSRREKGDKRVIKIERDRRETQRKRDRQGKRYVSCIHFIQVGRGCKKLLQISLNTKLEITLGHHSNWIWVEGGRWGLGAEQGVGQAQGGPFTLCSQQPASIKHRKLNYKESEGGLSPCLHPPEVGES